MLSSFRLDCSYSIVCVMEYYYTYWSIAFIRRRNCLYNWRCFIRYRKQKKIFSLSISYVCTRRCDINVYISLLFCTIKKFPKGNSLFYKNYYLANLSAVATATETILPKPSCLSSAVALWSFLMKWSVTVNKHNAFLLSLAALQYKA